MKKEYTFEELMHMVMECSGYDGSLEEYEYDYHDDEFFETYYDGRLDEMARAIYHGNYTYTDEYITINAYGNLETISRYEYEQLLEENKQEIIDTYNELFKEER